MLKLFARLEIERVVDRAKAHERNNEFIFTIKTIWCAACLYKREHAHRHAKTNQTKSVCLRKIPAQPNEMTETDGSSI